MDARTKEGLGAGDSAGSAAEAAAPRRGGRRGGDSSRRYSVAEKRGLLDELERSGETIAEFCSRRHVSSASICTWKRRLRSGGEPALAGREPRRNAKGHRGRERSADERRQAIEAFAKSGLTQQGFARVWGLSPWTLRKWLERYRAEGPKGLEPRRRGRRAGSSPSRPPSTAVPAAVRDEIARTKRRFPDFGLKRVRDFLQRFQGVRVSTGTVARVLDERGIERAAPKKRRRRSKPLPRRFERALANDLWQSDITSFVIGRSRLRVYLIVFLDDFSRFIVSHGLYVYQRAEIARETLLVGIGRFGQPKEVLTDQGRQYFAWRGKSDFQKLLAKQGIHHAVARAHHPETVGKCERFWETLKREFLDRVELEDLADARARLEHFVAHYNFFRPHQGVEGLVPADRYFGAQDALRRTHEARLAQDELALALERAPRQGAYLFGQIGDEQVSVFGERGQLVVHTSSGLRKEIGLDELGAPRSAQEIEHGRSDGRSGDGDTNGHERAPAQAADGQEAAALRGAGADAAGGEGAVAERALGGAEQGAPLVRADPVDVAGQAAARGGGEGARDPAPAGVAAQPAGALGYARGPAEAAPVAAQEGGSRERAPECGRSADPEEEDRGAREAGVGPAGPDRAVDPAPDSEDRAAGVASDPGGENSRPPSEGP